MGIIKSLNNIQHISCDITPVNNINHDMYFETKFCNLVCLFIRYGPEALGSLGINTKQPGRLILVAVRCLFTTTKT